MSTSVKLIESCEQWQEEITLDLVDDSFDGLVVYPAIGLVVTF